MASFKPNKKFSVILVLLLLGIALPALYFNNKQKSAKPFDTYSRDIGEVEFPISCAAATQKKLEHGLALTHHMMYQEAEQLFKSLANADPDCAMAHWGVAMILLHPLRTGRDYNAVMLQSKQALEKARKLKPPSQREKDYIIAAESVYHGWQTASQMKMIAAWQRAQKKLYIQHPDDVEAAVFYALALQATSPQDDDNYTHQRQAGKLLQKRQAQHPKHPGILHYILHAYDNPVLAPLAIQAADAYAKIAPEVPHALHMPGHIFVRLGEWKKVATLNARSAKTALNYPVNNRIALHYLHAQDYRMYALLQLAEDDAASALLKEVQNHDNYQPHLVSAYALAAIPARYYLERKQWQQAAQLKPGIPANFPWKKFPEALAITYFARGLGAVMNADTTSASKAIDQLNFLYQQTDKVGDKYWKYFIKIQQETLSAWIALSNDNKKQAIKQMTHAAAQEDSVEKHGMTPGHVLPARELLGDMFMATGDYGNAIAAYQTSLKTATQRFNSLYGIAKAYEASGKISQATDYYEKLIQLTNNSAAKRPALIHAKIFLDQHNQHNKTNALDE